MDGCHHELPELAAPSCPLPDELLPQVQYALGWANYQAGRETNALGLFTSFVTQFPTNELAPGTVVGGVFFSPGGTNFLDAEKNYELIFQNANAVWKNSSLFYPAQLMAGRSAEGRQGFPDAVNYLTRLIADTNCPPSTATQAMLAYGGVLMRKDLPTPTGRLANFEQATNVFVQVYQVRPNQ